MFLLNAGSEGANSLATSFPIEVVVQLFFILIVFGIIIVLAIYVTKLVGGARYVNRGNSNLKLMDSIGLGFQNGIHLVKVGKKYVLLGITKDRITFLCELNENEIPENESSEGAKPSFEAYLNRIMNKKNGSSD